MKPNPKISAAVAAILSAPATVIVFAATADTATVADTTAAADAAAPAASGPELQEVIVTANRREENLQDVPITIQALTGETLDKLNVTTFDDFVKYLPNVTAQGTGPGQNDIYMRGLATGETGIQGIGAVGSVPNVALYLDDQSAQVTGRNLDIYAADLERIEVLEGPQGTLFGAGAQAGVVRYITNKPKLNVTEANFNAAYETTAHGDQSNNLDATFNVPIIPGTLAARAVIYNESRGGYINNVAGTFARSPTDLGIHYAYAGGQVPVNSVVINNNNLVASAINPVTYKGMRVEGLWQINDDWNALLTQSYQDIRADGVFAEQQYNSSGVAQPELTVQLYNPSFDRDRFENTALSINGRVDWLKIVYTGAYLVRNVEQVQDYTNYARGPFVDYYQCANPGSTPATAQCFSPSSTWHDQERNTHQSHELRFSTPSNWRLRGVGGLFWEKYQVQEQVDWLYLTAYPYFHPIGPPTGYWSFNNSQFLPTGKRVPNNYPGAVFIPLVPTSNNPNIRPLGDSFFDDITRGYTQKAAYASFDFDLIPRRLTVTAGTRYYRIETREVGSDVGSFGCQLIFNATAPNPCVDHSNRTNLSGAYLDKTYSGFKSRANLTWRINHDAMVYYTFSQGFRAGGFNRGGEVSAGPLVTSPLAKLHGQFVAPLSYKPDTLTNNEVGWKTQWFDHRVQFNGAIYQEDWDDVQIGIFDPAATGDLTFSTNGGKYRVRGVEMTLAARVTSGLTVDGGVSYNKSELVRQGNLYWGDGTAIDFVALGLQNPTGNIGDPLASSPKWQGNLRARYDFVLPSDYGAFVQAGLVYQGDSLATTDRLTLDLQGNSIAYRLPAWTTLDGAVGVSRDDWVVQVYGENLTDKRAQLYANYRQWYKAVTTNRPRTVGLRISYRFTGK